jgi:hypothetical protein
MGLVNLQPICYNKDMHQNVADVIGTMLFDFINSKALVLSQVLPGLHYNKLIFQERVPI